MALKANFAVVIYMAVLFCTCTGVTVTIDSLDDVIEGSETRMICNYDPTSGGTIIIVWNNVTGASELIATTVVGGTKGVDPAYSAIFSLDPDDDRVLVIDNTLRSYSGDYQCEVTIVAVSSGNDDVTLNVIYLEDPVLSFTTPVNEGDPVTLSCDVVSKPNAGFTFKKDGSVLQQGGSSTYTFTADRNDQGSYTCEVDNNAGTKATAGQVLEVYFAPEITALEDMQVSRGERVVISFDVVARPAANYDWSSQDATDIDNDPETFTFFASNTIGDVYTVTLNASNEVAARQSTVQVTVVARTTTLITTNAFTTQPDSCGSLSIVNDGKQVDGNMNAEVDDDVSLRCQCGDSDEGFDYEWTLDGEKRSESTLTFTAEKSGHEVVCIGTAGAPEPSSVSINVLVSDKEPSTGGKGGIGTGAIVGIVVGILVMLIILGVVIIIVLKSRDDGPSKSADSAYMDVTWDTKDPNRVNQGKKTAPPSNGTKEAAKQDQYQPYGAPDDRAYSRPSYGSEDYNDRPDDDDYANSMPVTV